MGAIAAVLPVKRGERFFVEIASNQKEVREAQALRYRVFGEELGAKLQAGADRLDVDEFDPYCRHLLVREVKTGQVVGCTRLLTDHQAGHVGGFYSAGEFDLGGIPDLPGRLLEVGRTCIAPQYRQGSAIAILWSGLAGFIHLHGIDYLFGCASIPLGEGDVQATAMMNRIRRQAMADHQFGVTPHAPLLPTQVPDDVLDAPLPALVKAYIRLGAKACGEPCRDPDFAVADVLMLLNVDDINPAYSRHFLERIADA